MGHLVEGAGPGVGRVRVAGGEDGARARVGEAVAAQSCVFWDGGWEGSVWGWSVGAAEVADVAAHEDEGVGGGAGEAGDVPDGVLYIRPG